MSYSKTITQRITDYLTEQGWTYDYDSIHGIVSVEADLSCQLASAMVVYQATDTGFQCYTALPVEASPAVLPQVGEYLHRANYGLPNGNFALNYDDGSIHYKTWFDCPDGVPTPQQLRDSLAIGLTVVDHYGDGLWEVLHATDSLAKQIITELEDQAAAEGETVTGATSAAGVGGNAGTEAR